MDSGLTASDVLALTKDNDNIFGGSGASWLIILLLFMSNGFGGFGNNAVANYATQEQLFNVQKDILITSAATDSKVAQVNYDTLLAFKDMQGQMSSCCCDLKTTIHSEGEATRALITQNRIADLEKELNLAQTAIANTLQTQNILNSLGRYVTNPPSVNYNYPCNYPYVNGTQII